MDLASPAHWFRGCGCVTVCSRGTGAGPGRRGPDDPDGPGRLPARRVCARPVTIRPLPSFCRHNRLIQNCTICSREQGVQARPVVSSGAPGASQSRERPGDGDGAAPARSGRSAQPRESAAGRSNGRSSGGRLTVRKLARGVEDGFGSALLPGLRSSADADRLARELAYSTWRISLMERVGAGLPAPEAPPVWFEIAADGGDLEQRTLLAFTTVAAGARGVGGDDRLAEALAAYDTWTARSGSPVAAFTGETGWTPERRFERIFERLQFGGLSRDTRFELLTTLGRLGLYELRAGRLLLSGENEATWAAKRALGIADPLLLERRAAALAEACGVELEALDLALHNWGAGGRAETGLPAELDGDGAVLERARVALGL